MSPDSSLPDEINRWLEGRKNEFGELLPGLFTNLYADLKRRAHFLLQGSARGATLNTTGLVNEAYLRLLRAGNFTIQDRQHFLALTSKTMRYVLLDFARARKRQRRGGDRVRVTLDEARVITEKRADEFLDLEAALVELDRLDSRLGEVVELRYFGGLTVKDTAALLKTSERTVKRDWRAAKAFLASRLGSATP